MFEFAALWVFLLLPLPLLIYRYAKPSTRHTDTASRAVMVPYYQQLHALNNTDQNTQKTRPLRFIVLTIIWLLLLIACAKPQWVGDPQAVESSGRDLLLAVDISDSMSQEDMLIDNQPASRLITVKQVVSEFVAQRQGDRMGLILFGTNAYLQTPLTFDTDSVGQFLQEAQLGFAGPKTAIGDAIGLSVKRLKERQSNTNATDNSKVIILLTDGANTSGEVEPLQAAKLAAQIKAKIYTVGIGADEMTVRGFFGNQRINPSASLDEDTLTAIAETTDGQYFRARNTDELQTIYQLLDQLEPTEQEAQWLRPIKSLFMWPLAAALLLSILLALGICRLQVVRQWQQTLIALGFYEHGNKTNDGITKDDIAKTARAKTDTIKKKAANNG